MIENKDAAMSNCLQKLENLTISDKVPQDLQEICLLLKSSSHLLTKIPLTPIFNIALQLDSKDETIKRFSATPEDYR